MTLVQGIKAHSVFTTPDAQEHARVRNHMMKFFNADNVAATIGRLEEQMAASTAAITAAFAAASAKSSGAPGAHSPDACADHSSGTRARSSPASSVRAGAIAVFCHYVHHVFASPSQQPLALMTYR